MTTRRVGWVALLYLSLAGCAAQRAPVPVGPATLQAALAAMAKGDLDEARRRFASVIESRPGSIEAALARDAIVDLNHAQLLPAPRYDCPQDAKAAYDRAEELFLNRSLSEAIPEFQKAVDGCPQNAEIWIHFGDALFAQGDYERARQLFHEGVQRDPWNRSGHRFLCDAEMHLGNLEAAYRRGVLAVVSDPTYEAGWHYLHSIVWRLGGEWRRSFIVKPTIRVEQGKPTIHLFADAESEIRADGDNEVWMAYLLMRHRDVVAGDETAVFASALSPPADGAAQTALQREQSAVEKTLELYERIVAATPQRASKFWDQMRRARDAGFVREAIFLHLLDRDLAAEYPAYREHNGERLVRYVEQQVAPLSQSGVKHARVDESELRTAAIQSAASYRP